MPLCRLWNDNVHPYVDKKENITIAPKEAIEVDYEFAKDYLKKYSPIIVDGNNLPDPKYFKMLRIEKLGGVAEKKPEQVWILHKTGEVFTSQEAYDRALDRYLDDLHESDEKQKRIAKRGKQQREESTAPDAA